LQIGDTCSLRKVAKGKFTLDVESGHKHHLLIATVTGGAPTLATCGRCTKTGRKAGFAGDHKLYILFGASKSFEFGYEQELAKVAAEVPWLKFVPTVSRPWDDPEWKGEVGRVDELIRKYTDMWDMDGKTTTAYLCGHPDMIEHGKGILKRRGFPKESMREEVYWIPPKAGAKT